MSKFKVDYLNLNNKITKKAYKLSDVKDKLEAVGFDLVRFRDNDKGADLWQVQKSDDGDYIVALYEEDLTKTASSNWGVLVTSSNELQISYKNDPLLKIASSKLGIPKDQLHQVKQYLPEKLASNKKLVKALLNELNAAARQEVSKRYPELV